MNLRAGLRIVVRQVHRCSHRLQSGVARKGRHRSEAAHRHQSEGGPPALLLLWQHRNVADHARHTGELAHHRGLARIECNGMQRVVSD